MEDGQVVYVERVQVEKLEEEINVYNLEVDEWHTYFVAGGVLVHNRCKLGENMRNDPEGIGDPGTEYDAHHIFPQKYRRLFEMLGIDIDESDFGIWLEKKEHRKNAKSYNRLWEDFFKRYNFDSNLIEVSDILNYLDEIGRMW